MARIVAIEKGLEDRVRVCAARTRTPDSPYYAINPSGRVPCLVRDEGPNLEDSTLICTYFDQIGDGAKIVHPMSTDGWELGRLEMLARSYLDGVSVLSRERRRPESEQSPGIVGHELARAARLADVWEREIANPVMRGPLNMAQLTLICALNSAVRLGECDPFAGHPSLAVWAEDMNARPSLVATRPDVPVEA